ncbi:ABC transporter ATP-binding protein [Lishizhenia sp.]|uniref:ABC transporter ATP-binding protein n=1 Tax=Lishizhenia sp. TaxID=2497594 RepID=UPI00299E7EFE|nr:ABC transporter ATP-binding protein [Lishizhenia sp.]MDX1446736.1 ABC transporter ATP-binding protein [Lishizhenia sp.]
MESVLEVKGLTKKYRRLTAVDQIDLSIEKGAVYGLLGPNGSGKSTTLGMLLNVINPTAGTFSWFGGKSSPQDALKRIGALIERPNFYSYMTAYKNLELVCKIKQIDTANISEKLTLVGLGDRQHDAFKTFSLGMKQRLAIASALLNNPDVLILDEPTNGFDPQGILQIRQLIKDIAKSGTTVILASHLLDEVEKVCTHVLILQKGKMLYNGKVDELIASNGFFELKADNAEEMIQQLKLHNSFEKITEADGLYRVFFKDVITPSSLNHYLMQNGVSLSHLVFKKESLEEQFIQLTQA